MRCYIQNDVTGMTSIKWHVMHTFEGDGDAGGEGGDVTTADDLVVNRNSLCSGWWRGDKTCWTVVHSSRRS